jgi:hypothetical protein
MHDLNSTPSLGADVRLKLNGPIFLAIENWRRSQERIPCRSEAVRQLVEQALAAAPQRGSAAA